MFYGFFFPCHHVEESAARSAGGAVKNRKPERLVWFTRVRSLVAYLDFFLFFSSLLVVVTECEKERKGKERMFDRVSPVKYVRSLCVFWVCLVLVLVFCSL